MIKYIKYGFLTLIVGVIFSGCVAKPKIALEYRPASVLELEGRVSVNNFGYLPKEGVTQKQIPNTALGDGLFLDDPIGVFFSNAVRREFRQSGLSIKTGSCELDGEVNELLIDDLGFTVDLITDVRYILYNKDKKVLMDNTYNTKLDGLSKFVQASVLFQNLNKMFSKNIESFMKDPQFVKSLEKECSKNN